MEVNEIRNLVVDELRLYKQYLIEEIERIQKDIRIINEQIQLLEVKNEISK